MSIKQTPGIEVIGRQPERTTALPLEEIVDRVGIMIDSAPIGAVSADNVIDYLGIMKIPDPEQYREMIDRMISVDVGRTEEKIDE